MLPELVETCRSHDFTDIVVVHEHRGEPDGLVVCHLPYGPTAFFGLYNTARACPHPVRRTGPPRGPCLPPAARARRGPAWGVCDRACCHACACWRASAFCCRPGRRGGRGGAQVLRHDIGEKKKVGTVSEAYPHLVLDNFTSKLGARVANILRYLFPCPKARARALTFSMAGREGLRPSACRPAR